jgi:hypothetical protein
MIVAGIGVLGAAAAFVVAEHFSWRNAYFTGGGMGLLLLLLRAGIFESGMYKPASESKADKGNFFMIFAKKERLLRYIYCICISLPIWFVVGILITQAPELGEALGAPETLSAGKGIMLCYMGTAIGEVIAGFIAQVSKSRRLSLLLFHIMSLIAIFIYLGSTGISTEKFSYLAFFIGFSVGYWASFITVASEQFGTNLRATVTTTAPNLVRAALIPITFLFEFFVAKFNIITAGYIVMSITTFVAIFALSQLKESFDKDLDYIEE